MRDIVPSMMVGFSIAKRILFAALVCFITQGCAFYRNHQTQLIVTSVETGKPVAAAPVKTVYVWASLAINPPKADSAVTDEAGRATIRIATDCGPLLMVGDDWFAVQPKQLTEGGVLTQNGYARARNRAEPTVRVEILADQ